MPNYRHYIDSNDYLRILGEVWNNTATGRSHPKVTANIFAGSGQLVAEGYDWTNLNSLDVGDKTCFDIKLDVEAVWTYYELEIYPGSPRAPPPNVVAYNVFGDYEFFGWYTLVGRVRNDSASTVNSLRVIATLYDASGAVVACSSGGVKALSLVPGQTSSFKMILFEPVPGIVTYRVQVDAQVQ